MTKHLPATPEGDVPPKPDYEMLDRLEPILLEVYLAGYRDSTRRASGAKPQAHVSGLKILHLITAETDKARLSCNDVAEGQPNDHHIAFINSGYKLGFQDGQAEKGKAVAEAAGTIGNIRAVTELDDLLKEYQRSTWGNYDVTAPIRNRLAALRSPAQRSNQGEKK